MACYGLNVIHKDKALQVAPPAKPAMSMPVPVPNLLGAVPGMTPMAATKVNRMLEDEGVASIEGLVELAVESGVKLFPSSMTVEVLGYHPSDFIDGGARPWRGALPSVRLRRRYVAVRLDRVGGRRLCARHRPRASFLGRTTMSEPIRADSALDRRGMRRPMPIAKTGIALRRLENHQALEVLAMDPGPGPDFQALAAGTGCQLLGQTQEGGVYRHYLRKAG